MLDLPASTTGQLKLTPVQFDLTEVACNTLLSFEQRIENKKSPSSILRIASGRT
ncbi:MAG: hypothetical protein ACLSS9_01320 [Acutalibacteraceae bacterium]